MADKFIQIVYSNPLQGRDDEFNVWYDNVHVPQLLAVPGMLSAQRYNLLDSETVSYTHLTLPTKA